MDIHQEKFKYQQELCKLLEVASKSKFTIPEICDTIEKVCNDNFVLQNPYYHLDANDTHCCYVNGDRLICPYPSDMTMLCPKNKGDLEGARCCNGKWYCRRHVKDV